MQGSNYAEIYDNYFRLDGPGQYRACGTTSDDGPDHQGSDLLRPRCHTGYGNTMVSSRKYHRGRRRIRRPVSSGNRRKTAPKRFQSSKGTDGLG